MKKRLSKFTLAASLAAALAFTFSSCSADGEEPGDNPGGGTEPSSSSGGDDGDGGSREIVETYALEVDKEAGTFTIKVESPYEGCADGGVLETMTESWSSTQNYSISDGILSLDYGWWPGNDSDADRLISFTGTSSELTGTWTRTKNTDASCASRIIKEEGYKYCVEGYNIIKMVFENNTVKITRDYCWTDTFLDGSAKGGGIIKIIDCDTYELHNGTDKVRIKRTETYEEASYNGKSCKVSEVFTKAQKEAACKESLNTRADDYRLTNYGLTKIMRYILNKDFYDCLKKTLPTWFYRDNDYWEWANEPLSSSSSNPDGSSSSNWETAYIAPCPNAVTIDGSVTCGGKTYRTVPIGTQTWMAENLNYAAEGSVCYDNSEANCDIYGRLYDWSTAMALPSYCNENYCANRVNSQHRGICPSGWHIPTYGEWDMLSNYVQNANGCSNCDAKHLKATSGWKSGGNGEDSFGFSALPGGIGYDGDFDSAGYSGYWWSGSARGDYRFMYYDSGYARWSQDDLSFLFSVRCVQD